MVGANGVRKILKIHLLDWLKQASYFTNFNKLIMKQCNCGKRTFYIMDSKAKYIQEKPCTLLNISSKHSQKKYSA